MRVESANWAPVDYAQCGYRIGVRSRGRHRERAPTVSGVGTRTRCTIAWIRDRQPGSPRGAGSAERACLVAIGEGRAEGPRARIEAKRSFQEVLTCSLFVLTMSLVLHPVNSQPSCLPRFCHPLPPRPKLARTCWQGFETPWQDWNEPMSTPSGCTSPWVRTKSTATSPPPVCFAG